MSPSSQELTNNLTKLRSKLEDLRKQGLALENDGKSIGADGKPLTREAQAIFTEFGFTRQQIKLTESRLKTAVQLESLRNGDPIAVASQKVQLNDSLQKAADKKAALESLGKAGTEEWNRATNTINQATDKLKTLSTPSAALDQAKQLVPIPELPIQPDPELIKREALARAQKLRSDAELLLQQKKEEELNKIRGKVDAAGGFVSKAAGIFLKMPIVDPKFIAYTAYKQAKAKIRELKQKASKENLKKSKEAFTFPMKPPVKLDLGELPQIKAPTIPEIPTNLPSANPIPPNSEANAQAQPNLQPPTAPIRSKFTYAVDGGGGEAFFLAVVLYDGRPLTINDWPINRRFAPTYGYSAEGKSYADGIQSVRARIQDSILRGDFDRYVSAPF